MLKLNVFTGTLDYVGSTGGTTVNFSANETLTNTGDDAHFTFATAPTNVLAVWASETGQVITDYSVLGSTLTLGTAMPGYTIKATSTN